MRVNQPFLLLFSVFRILSCRVPKTVYGRGTRPPVEWPVRITFAGVGVATLLLWDSQLPNGCTNRGRSDSSRIQLL